MIQRRSRAPGTGAVLANCDIRPQSARALPPLPHLTRTLEQDCVTSSLAPSPQASRCHASSGAWPMRWSMRGPWICWALSTATMSDSPASSRTSEAGVLPVGGDPGDRQRGGECSQDHDAGQVVLRREATFAGDLGSAAALDGVGPGLGQVEPAVDQGVAQGGGVGGEDADLAALGAAGGVGVGPVYAG